MFEVYGLIIPENADALFALGENIDELYMIDELLDISELVWKKQKYYYLTFNPNSGTGSMSDQTMPCGTAAALFANLFNRIGYLFQGWNSDADGDALYTDEQEVTDIAGAGETLTLYAIWKAITWYVKFHANGGAGSMEDQAHAYDTEQALSINAFEREGYALLGWGTSPAGSVVYGDGATVKNLKSVHGAVLNLYALWKRLTTVLFDTNDNETETRRWYLKKDSNNGTTNGWFTAACQTDEVTDNWNQIDCTDYNYCTVRIKGNITSIPSSATVNTEYIKIGFTDDRNEAVEVVKKSANGDASEVSQSGLASNKWYDLTIDVSALSGIQTLNVFIGGSYQNGGYLHCSKITMSVD